MTEKQPEELQPINWEKTVGANLADLRQQCRSLLSSNIPGDLKRQIVKDFYDIGYRNDKFDKQERDMRIALQLDKDMDFGQTLIWLSIIANDKPKGVKSFGDNLEALRRALEGIAIEGKNLTSIIAQGNRPNAVGSIGNILSMGDEIMAGIDRYYHDRPDTLIAVTPFCETVQAIARKTDRIRQSSQER